MRATGRSVSASRRFASRTRTASISSRMECPHAERNLFSPVRALSPIVFTASATVAPEHAFSRMYSRAFTTRGSYTVTVLVDWRRTSGAQS